MAQNKTRQTDASVESYLADIADETRRQDCCDLVKLMSKVSVQPPKMWGPSIVGFGSYHYRYESGHEGEICVIGFSARKGDISLYIRAGAENLTELLGKLGKHRMGKSCLYIRKLSDVNLKVLEEMISISYSDMKARHP